MLENDALLDAIFTSTHPEANLHMDLMNEAFANNKDLAEKIASQKQDISSIRKSTEEKLRSALELQRKWQEIEKDMYIALKVWPSSSLLNAAVFFAIFNAQTGKSDA